MHALKITTTGNSLAVALPKSVTDRLHLQKGDQIFLVDTEDGVRLTPFDPHFERTMQVAGELMDRYRNTARELAKT
jgi:putative addiction module antidote